MPGSFINENQAVEGQYTVLSHDDISPTTQHFASDLTPSPKPHIFQNEPSCVPVTLAKDAFYLDRYCYILGPWFDLFDVKRQFSLVVPHLSLSHALLHLSVLACAAKQYYLTHLIQPAGTALLYYDRALRMLTASLNEVSRSSSPAVFASCILLAECEMIGDSYQDWHLHLEGTYSLISTHGWNGCSGGLPEACFWIYCRMDVLSSLASAKLTHLDTSLWLPSSDALAPQDGLDGWSVDAWSNYTVLLLAQIHNQLCKVRSEEPYNPPSSLFEEWNALQERIDTHERRQPLQFRPLAVLDTYEDNNQNPFPCVRYLNETICSATQLFDLAHLLLILARPERSRHDRVARFATEANIFMAYVKRVIANSINNRHEINWVCAVQLLSSAGLALTEWTERKALLKCLNDVHVQTGWNTKDNINGLLAWWGWAAPLNERGQTWNDVHQEIGPYASAGEWMLRMYDAGVIMAAARREGQSR